MGARGLSDAGVIGAYFARLEQTKLDWVEATANTFQADKIGTQTVRFVGTSPTFRKWDGERQARGLSEHSILIDVDKYEATLSLEREELTLDKTPQTLVRIRDLAARSNQHWARMVIDAFVAGEATLAYDGQYFFDTDHVDGESGTQDNDLAFTVADANSRLPTAVELKDAYNACVDALYGMLDDRGEPMNEAMTKLTVLCPTGLRAMMRTVLSAPLIVSGSTLVTNTVATDADIQVSLAPNARLNAQTDWWSGSSIKFIVVRTDADIKPIIRFQDSPANGPGVKFSALGSGSEHEFKTGEHLYGADARRGVGYGAYQYAVLSTGTT